MNQNTLKKHNYNDDILLRKVLSKFFGRKCTSLLAKIDQIDQYRPLDVQNPNFFKFFIQKNLLMDDNGRDVQLLLSIGITL